MVVLGLDRLQGKRMDAGNCAFLPEVANEEAFAGMTMEVDEDYLRKQVDQFRHLSAYRLECCYDRDLCCGGLGAAEVHGHAGLAKDSVETGDLFRHRLFCRPRFASLPLSGS